MKFRTWTILWVFALLASALATFGGVGIWLVLTGVFFWALVFNFSKFTAWEWLVIFVIVIAVIATMLPAVQSARESARRNSCMNYMKHILLAIHNYHDQKGTLPSAYLASDDGNKLLSWRYLILPFLEQENLYKRLRRDETWDSTYNATLLSQAGPVYIYHCPTHNSQAEHSDYLAIIGKRTAWLTDRGRAFNDFIDGSANTIVLIEAPHKKISWAEPEDLNFEEAVDLLSNSLQDKDFGHEIQEGFFYKPTRGINVGFADGHAQFLRLPIPKEHAIALLTINGGEEVLPTEVRRLTKPELNYGRIYSLSVFVLLLLLPAFKLAINHKTVAYDPALSEDWQ